jgi:hypothetical protein
MGDFMVCWKIGRRGYAKAFWISNKIARGHGRRTQRRHGVQTRIAEVEKGVERALPSSIPRHHASEIPLDCFSRKQPTVAPARPLLSHCPEVVAGASPNFHS